MSRPRKNARSAAARKGWETRRRRAEEASERARRGWETRRAREAEEARQAAAKRPRKRPAKEKPPKAAPPAARPAKRPPAPPTPVQQELDFPPPPVTVESLRATVDIYRKAGEEAHRAGDFGASARAAIEEDRAARELARLERAEAAERVQRAGRARLAKLSPAGRARYERLKAEGWSDSQIWGHPRKGELSITAARALWRAAERAVTRPSPRAGGDYRDHTERLEVRRRILDAMPPDLPLAQQRRRFVELMMQAGLSEHEAFTLWFSP